MLKRYVSDCVQGWVGLAIVSRLTPIAGLALDFGVYPGVVHSPLRVPLRQAERLILVLSISLTALDADVSRLDIVLIVEEQPTIVVPDRYTLVHAIVPSLEPLDGTFRRATEKPSKVLLDALPLLLLVVPGIDDEVTLFGGVLLIDVPSLRIRRRAWVSTK